MEVLLSYNVGLSSINIARDLSGNYYYLVDDIDPEKYETVAKLVSKALEHVNPRRSAGIYDIVRAVLTYLKNYDPELVAYVVSRELKYKKLQVLLDDPYVEDVSIVGTGPVWVRHKYVLEKDPSADYIETNIVITTYEEFMNYMELIAERSGRVVNKRAPIMDFTLPEDDGGHRVHIVLPDVAHSTGEIVIRKKLYHGSIDLDSLVKAGMVPGPVAELIKLVVRRGGSIVILGPPGSGKTTLLKAVLYSVIPRFWKIAIIEDTPEVDIPKGASWVKYTVPTDVWGSDRGVDQMTLAKAALRASVSRFLVIGETRGAEARVLAQAMNMGLGGLCLPEDQLVLANVDGRIDLYEIRDLVDGVLRGSHRSVEVVSLGPDLEPVWQPISAVVVKKGSGRFIKVEVEGGATHEVHEDHIVVIAKGGSDLSFKKAKELGPGDLLVSLPYPPEPTRKKVARVAGILAEHATRTENLNTVISYTHAGSLGSAESSDPQGRLHASYFEPSVLPQRPELDESLGYIVGMYLAVGHIDQSHQIDAWRVRFDIDPAKLNKLLDALAKIGASAEMVKVAGGLPESPASVFLESRPLARSLASIAGGSSDNELKRVPLDLALVSGEEFRVGLIKGYYDGASRRSSPEFDPDVGIKVRVPGRKLAESLALVLKTLGIQPSVKPVESGGDGYYEVSIETKEDVERFRRLIKTECDRSHEGRGLDTVNPGQSESGLVKLRVRRVETVEKQSMLYDIEVPGSHLYAISGSLILTHNTTFHAGSPEEALVRLTSPPIELAPQQLTMIWLFITLGFLEDKGLRRTVIRVDEPVLRSSSLTLNTIYRYGEDLDLETLLKRFSRARDLWA